MRISGWWTVAVALALGCGTPAEKFEKVPVRTFSTEACAASALPRERRPPDKVPGFERWLPPSRRVEHLLDRTFEVSGSRPKPSGDLARWSGSDLAGWKRVQQGARWVWQSPEIGPVAKADRLRLVLHPGPVRDVDVIVSTHSTVGAFERAHRVVHFTLDPPKDPSAPQVLTADLEPVLSGNWMDAARPAPVLRSIELSIAEKNPDDAKIDEITIDGTTSLYPHATGVVSANVDGVVRPSLYLWGGTSARVDLQVPSRGARVVFYEAAGVGPVAGRVVVDDGEQSQQLYRSDDLSREGWVRRTLDLGPFADQHVVLEFTAQGSGVALFGGLRLIGVPLPERTPNVIVYVIDTLRADHVDAWGDREPNVTPNLDKLALEGAQFGQAIAVAPWTKPSIPSLMTGLYPTTHQVGYTRFTDRLPDGVPTVQARFQAAGWRTGSFSASPLGSTLSHLDQGFDVTMAPEHWRGHVAKGFVQADQLHSAVRAFVDEEPATPFFAYVHTLEPHEYARPQYAHGQPGPYDAAVHDADGKLGVLLGDLRAEGIADHTLIVVVSDHGESFGDHGVEHHGTSDYQSQVHIPMIFWAGSDIGPLTVDHPVSLVDVAPTLLDLFGLTPLPHADGVSLVPYLEGKDVVLRTHAPSARVRYVSQPDDPPIYSVVRDDGTKLIRQGKDEQVFDVATDPCEAKTTGEVPLRLRKWLDDWLAAQARAAAAFHAAHPLVQGPVDAGQSRMQQVIDDRH